MLCLQIITVFRRDEVEGAAPMPKLVKCDYVRTVRAGLLEESIGEHFLPTCSTSRQFGHVENGGGGMP